MKKDQRIEILIDENAELRKENENLRAELEQAIYWKVEKEKAYKQVSMKKDELLEENKTLKEKYDGLWEIYIADVKDREEENKKLRENISWYEKEEDRLREENKKLKFDIEARKEMKKAREEKISFLEECLDRKEELNAGYRKEMKLSTIAEETISDLQARINELSEENGQLKENEKYRHSRCMKAERQVQHSLGGDDEEGLYD